MAEIAMSTAAEKMKMRPNSARRALQNAGYPLRELTPRMYVIEEAEVERYISEHGVSTGRGRPKGTKKSATVEKSQN